MKVLLSSGVREGGRGVGCLLLLLLLSRFSRVRLCGGRAGRTGSVALRRPSAGGTAGRTGRPALRRPSACMLPQSENSLFSYRKRQVNTNPKCRYVDFPYISSVRTKEKLIRWYFCISLLSSIRRQAALPIFRFLTACIFISPRRAHEMILADEFEERHLTPEDFDGKVL